MIRVLIVDDSPVVRDLLVYILEAAPEIEIAGTAYNGRMALSAIESLRPDIVTMDLNMPEMNGFEATRQIMETAPVPIVIVSGSWDTNEVATTFRALEAGALAVVARPPGIGHPDHAYAAAQLVQTVRSMSQVKVVRRWPRAVATTLVPAPSAQELRASEKKRVDIVAIGASTGGPIVTQTILKALPEDFRVPIVIVQHLAPGFVQGFSEWLASTTGRPVMLGGQGVRLADGHTYIAPDGHQMTVDAHRRIQLHRATPENGFAPSVSYLFRSLIGPFGARTAAVLLSGMGSDGARELRSLRDAGAITFVQDRESSIVFGMPGEAMRRDAAQHVLPPLQIAKMLSSIAAH